MKKYNGGDYTVKLISSGNNNIDKDSVIPYYYQIKENLKYLIEEKKLAEGERIPSEMELCQAYGVSRTVVRQALNELASEGLIIKSKGKGTFVARPKIIGSLMQNIHGFHKDMTRKDLTIKNKVLEFSVIKAGKKVSDKLQLKPGLEIFKLVRLRFINNEPIVYVTSYIPHSFCPNLLNEDFSKQSLYNTLEEKYGLEIASSHRNIEAVSAPEEISALMGIEKKAPLLLLGSISYLKNGLAVEYFEAFHRGDRSGFAVELIRAPGQNMADTFCLKSNTL